MPHGAETKTLTIEGRRVTVVDRTPPLPPKLDALFAELFGIRLSRDLRPTGATSECEVMRMHALTPIREGRHFGRDRVLRDLRVLMCSRCAAVCVRDISYDIASVGGESVPTGRNGPNRRDEVIGWYSGARRNQRQYR
jgi:hypothetical protein